jgi:hypothetical protein
MSTEGAASPDRLAHLAASIRRRIARVVHEATDADREFRTRAPSALELRGMGDLVHDFYTGLERVFEKVSSEFDGGVPAGRAWHRDLLDTMALEIVRRRPALLRQETTRQLDEFLRFRHLFRNVYGYELQWSRIQPLLQEMPRAWREVSKDLEAFATFLERVAAAGS